MFVHGRRHSLDHSLMALEQDVHRML